MAQGSYFKGLHSMLPTSRLQDKPIPAVEPIFGQVIEVLYDSENPEDIGSIRVKINKLNSDKSDDTIFTSAHPADRNMIKYPVPGELVALTVGPTDYQSGGNVAKRYYYTTIIAAAGNITYNSNPYFLNKVGAGESSQTFNGEFEKRYEAKLVNNQSFILDGYIVNRPMLQPFEGDILLQGRWGGSIRFGSTGFQEKNQWSNTDTLSGNPITTMVVNRPSIVDDPSIEFGSVKTVVEDINNDDSSIYVSSMSKIPIILSMSGMKSLDFIYNVGDVDSSESGDSTAFIKAPIQPAPSLGVPLAAGGYGAEDDIETGGTFEGDGTIPDVSNLISFNALNPNDPYGSFFQPILAGESKTYNDHNWYVGKSYKSIRGYIEGRGSKPYSLLKKALSQYTIGEIMEFQARPRDEIGQLWATGRFQIIPNTLKGLVNETKISTSNKYDYTTQNIFGAQLLKNRGKIWNYIQGKVDNTSENVQKAALEMAKVWSSLGVPYEVQGRHRVVKKDQSYYSGGGDRAHVKSEVVIRKLSELRASLVKA